MFSRVRVLYITLIFLVGNFISQAQELTAPSDSLAYVVDTTAVLPADSIPLTDTIPPRKNALEAPVAYDATDSIIMTAGNWAYLFGDGHVKYQQIELESEIIEMNMDSSIVFAKFGLDSIGAEFGYPLFKDGGQEYESKTMRYNFKSRKGYITDVITQQGEGYVTAGRTKKMEDDILNMVGGRYTTCDEHDHPHFYIQMTKAKVRPKKNIVTGPVYLVIEDVPLYPLMLPFAFFPFSETYSSGVLFPTFGDESARGFFLRDGGYYFAFNDYIDMALTGQIYTKGSWGLNARSNYKKRYKFSGNFNIEYLVTKLGDKNLPDYSVQKTFKINATHTQDPKANPYRTISASVNFATAGHDRVQNTTAPSSTENTKGSSVNITQRFPNNPFSISATMNINQSSRDTMLSVTFPDVTVSMSRIFPFKRKQAVGSERWYEKISMSYTGYLRNSLRAKEYDFVKANIVKDWKNAMQHQIPVSATFNLFNYINISPTFNYTERWYTNKVEEMYDSQQKRVITKDTTYGFYRVYNYNASVSMSTTLYGTFKPLPFLGDFVQTIRHRVDPSITIGFTPDFSNRRYGFYDYLQYENDNGELVDYVYSPFKNGMFGIPNRGQQGNVSFSLDNNLEAKIKSDSDSTGFRKISIIDKLGLSMTYNMVADSFKWSDLSVNLRLKFSKSYTLNLSGVFDTYLYDYTENNGVRTPRRIDKMRITAGKGIGRLRSTSTSFSYTFNNDTFKKGIFAKIFGISESDSQTTDDSAPPDGTDGEFTDELAADESLVKPEGGRLRQAKKEDTSDRDADGYWINTVPWSLSFNYSLNLNWDMTNFNYEKKEYPYQLTHALTFSGNIQPTKNWRFNFNATYDFEVNKISYLTCNISRNLHCFTMTANISPVGNYKFYTFSIAVSSSLLKDLKYDRRSNYRDGQTWY